MSNDTLTAIIQFVIGGIILGGGQYLVARKSNKAQEKTIQVDSQSEATKAWQDYATEMRERLSNVEQRVDSQQRQIEEGRTRIAALERQGERDKELIRRLVDRLRRAINEIKRLGGTVPDSDTDLTDMAQLRLDLHDSSI